MIDDSDTSFSSADQFFNRRRNILTDVVSVVLRIWNLAYSTQFVSLPCIELNQLCSDLSYQTKPSKIEQVSHHLASLAHSDIQPLGKLIGKALDDGEILHPDINHKFRVPIYHHLNNVILLHSELTVEWNKILQKEKLALDNWYRIEIEKLISIFDFAASNQECIVNVIYPLRDKINKVKLNPFI